MIARNLLCLLLLSLLGETAIGAPDAGPPAASAQLNKSDMSEAIQADAITIPTPGELFAALTKPAKPDWASRFRGPISSNYKTRAHIARNLGGLIADGCIAVEGQDTQQVKNAGSDIMKMAKALGVSEGILARGTSINQC